MVPEQSVEDVPTVAPVRDTPTEAVSVSSSPAPTEAPTLIPPAASEAEAATLVPPVYATCQLEPKSPEATHVDLAAGILGPYREVRPLRAWKSGTLYSAVHLRLRRQVELQVLDDAGHCREIGLDPISRDSFLQTARKAAAIRHPNVETGLLEAATYGGVTFVARELSRLGPVEGFGPRNRSQRRREPLYPNEALAQTLLDAARGLAEIHSAGLHHGYMTCAMLRRGSHGQACIAGLGLEPTNPNQERPTPAEIVCDPTRNDLFNFGWSFAEIVCGKVPALGGPPGRLADRLRRLNPGLSHPLAGILEQCLTVSGARQFSDAQELVHAIELQTKLQTRPLSLRTRFWTQLPDGLLLFLPAFAAVAGLFGTGILHPIGLPLLLNGLAAGLFMYPIWETLLGWTPGRRLRGLRLLDAAGERPPRWRLFVRCLIRLSWLFLVVYSMEQAISELLKLAGTEQHEVLEHILKAFVGFGMVVVFPLLAIVVLYSTGRWTPDGRPVHDYLTGISWYQRRSRRVDTVLEMVGTDQKARPIQRLPATPASGAGQVLGRMDQYELRGLLGQGGMGAVYEAHDTLLERRVALKVLSGSVSATPEVLQRFEREARLAAQLSHPNIAQVFGVGEAGGQPYIVMEFVDGEDLQKLVQREGPLSLARAWDYVRQTALALREAARQGIVHRDIKPANLILAGNDIVKVTDFGISRAFGEEEEKPDSAISHASGKEEDKPESSRAAAPATIDASLTRTGALLGTPQYFSPEQSRGEKLDQRSDIYSLGMTFYFLISGRPAFEGNDLYDLVMRHCNEEPSTLEDRVAGWTPDRDSVLQRMIAKDRADRFQDYDGLLKRLDATAPQPATLAWLGRRAGAEAIDLLLAASLSWAPSLPCRVFIRDQQTAADVSKLLNYVLFCAIYIFGIGRWGTTPGKWLLHLKVIRPGSPQLGYGRAFVRLLVLYPVILGTAFWSLRIFAGGKDSDSTEPWFVLTIILLMINCCLILFGARRRGLHDLAAGTLVIRLPNEPGRWGRLFESLSLRRKPHL